MKSGREAFDILDDDMIMKIINIRTDAIENELIKLEKDEEILKNLLMPLNYYYNYDNKEKCLGFGKCIIKLDVPIFSRLPYEKVCLIVETLYKNDDGDLLSRVSTNFIQSKYPSYLEMIECFDTVKLDEITMLRIRKHSSVPYVLFKLIEDDFKKYIQDMPDLPPIVNDENMFFLHFVELDNDEERMTEEHYSIEYSTDEDDEGNYTDYE